MPGFSVGVGGLWLGCGQCQPCVQSYMYIVGLGLQASVAFVFLSTQPPLATNVVNDNQVRQWPGLFPSKPISKGQHNKHFTYLRDLDIRIVRVRSRGCS